MDHPSVDFADFYRQFGASCLRTVYASLGDRLLAEEFVSEGFARACASWRKVGRHPAPQAWVVRTALNLNVSWWRRRRREIVWNDVDLPDRHSVESSVTGDLAVISALAALPARQREVVALRILLDLDVETTAATLRIAPGTVKAHLHRAIAAMRHQLTPITEKGKHHDPVPR
jgi:RNA polymerase sigma-70 factor (ECF subfamily)